MRIAFVSFANNHYIPIRQKLIDSIREFHPEADIYAFSDFSQIKSPSHTESPYAFKIYSIEQVKKLGYDIIFWIDSPFRLVRRIDSLIPEIESRGVYAQKDGWMCGQWVNDKTLSYFGLTRDEALQIPNIYACIIAFDLRNPITDKFIEEWKKCSENGLFFGRWKNDQKTESDDTRCLGHRHDQSCAELILYKLNIPLGRLLVGDKYNIDRYFRSWDNP